MYQFTAGAASSHQSPAVTHIPQYGNQGRQPPFQASPLLYERYQSHHPQQPPWSALVSATQKYVPQHQNYPLNQQPPCQPQGYPSNQHPQPQQYGNYPQVPALQAQQQYGGYSPAPIVPPQQTPGKLAHTDYSFNAPQQQQASPVTPTSIASRLNESCYNCGASGHFAQTCPEPRRAVPAGQFNRPRPFKKQKTYGGVAHIYPSGPAQLQVNIQRGWTHPSPNQSSFATPQSPPAPSVMSTNGQPTWNQPQVPLNSVNTKIQYPWSQKKPQQTPANVISQNPWNQSQYPQRSASTNSQYPWNQQQSPQTLNTVPEGVNTNFQSLWNQQRQQPVYPQVQGQQWSHQGLPTPTPSSNDSQIPSPATSTLNSHYDHHAQQTPDSYVDSAFPRNDSITSLEESPEAKPQVCSQKSYETVKDKPEAASQVLASSAQAVTAQNENQEVDDDWQEELQALDYPDNCEPSDVAVSDLSKFVHDMNDADYLSNVQDRPQWGKMKDDPIFAKIRANTETVTFDELILRRNELLAPIDVPFEESHLAYITSQAEESDEGRLSREQEERLATLGVSGFAKPVKPSATRSFSGTAPEEPLDTCDARSPASQGRNVSTSNMTENPSPAEVQNARNHDFVDANHGLPEANDSTTHPPYGASNSFNPTSGSFGPSPLQQPYFDRSQSLQSSPNELPNDPTTNGHSLNAQDSKRRLQHSPDSATTNDSRAGQNPRKRSYRQVSEESDGRAKRQDQEAIDRRKHPKVAAAYSRRW